MIVVSFDRLHTFIGRHKRGSDAKPDLLSWYWHSKSATWRNPHDVKASYPKASILKGGVVIFNIRGNEFRLITRINFQTAVVLVEWIGTHQEYDRIAAEDVKWKE
jgi:mRNA interferase HigB